MGHDPARGLMPSRIEDYALVGDGHTAALVSRDGSIDWLCVPRFDSPACFAALLGTEKHGHWRIGPAGPARVERRYRDDTLVLETTFATAEGTARVVDFMPPRSESLDLIRVVEGVEGRTRMRLDLVIRFDYGAVVPWVRRMDDGALRATAGPDTLELFTDVPLRNHDLVTDAEFEVAAGQRLTFHLRWIPTYGPTARRRDPAAALAETEAFWRDWAGRCTYEGEWRDAVVRSFITLKALIYAPTGAIVAAPTTSLPEAIGGVRNWDYRFCWVRDATFTLYALMGGGYVEEAERWRQWLVNAVAGTPSEMQIMYGLGGERRLTELELPWLPGHEGSPPVRIGNDAYRQHQLDIYGELMASMLLARRRGLPAHEDARRVQHTLLHFLADAWRDPDEGVWEVRGPRRHFTHSKVMAWVAFDRAVKMAEEFEPDKDVERWRALRDEVHAEVCREGFDRSVGAFTQYYGSKDADASLLMMPLVGFLPPEDPRIEGTVAHVQATLLHDGFVDRYPPHPDVDGLPHGEGAFLLCTFWLADNLALAGRYGEGREVFTRLLALRNDVGLLSEQYDPAARRFLGNFPQAFSHVGLINTARNLTARDRRER